MQTEVVTPEYGVYAVRVWDDDARPGEHAILLHVPNMLHANGLAKLIEATVCGVGVEVIEDDTRDEVRAEIDALYACPNCRALPVGPGSTSCEKCGSALPQGRAYVALVAAGRIEETRAAMLTAPDGYPSLAQALTIAGVPANRAYAAQPETTVETCKRCGNDLPGWMVGSDTGFCPSCIADKQADAAKPDLHKKIMCSRCGEDTNQRWVGGCDPGPLLCSLCEGTLKAELAGYTHMRDGDSLTVDNGMKNITVELVECPRCHLMLADPGAPYCDGCAEGL